jgi:pimeloyl-ACP methyl ester carboxylesterase
MEMKARRRFGDRFVTALGIITALILTSIGMNLIEATSVSASTLTPNCSMVSLPVSTGPGQVDTLTMEGQLCLPDGPTPTAVELLVHGITYDHSYWNPPVDPATNSYVGYALAARYATYAPDRIGDGVSSHPFGTTITGASNAWQMHQAVQALRNGAFGVSFRSVAYVGHSLGSIIAWEEANYHEVDAFVLSDALHGISLNGSFNIPLNATWPASLDPRLGPVTHYDPTYFTTAPGARGELFYDLANSDPSMIAWDEANKQTYTVTELASLLPAVYTPAVAVSVPTMVAVGQEDKFFCGVGGADCSSAATVKAHEAAYYPNTTISAFVLPNSGHDINLGESAPAWFTAAENFLQGVMPPRT